MYFILFLTRTIMSIAQTHTFISCSEALRTLMVVAFLVFRNCSWFLSLWTACFKSFLLKCIKMGVEGGNGQQTRLKRQFAEQILRKPIVEISVYLWQNFRETTFSIHLYAFRYKKSSIKSLSFLLYTSKRSEFNAKYTTAGGPIFRLLARKMAYFSWKAITVSTNTHIHEFTSTWRLFHHYIFIENHL